MTSVRAIVYIRQLTPFAHARAMQSETTDCGLTAERSARNLPISSMNLCYHPHIVQQNELSYFAVVSACSGLILFHFLVHVYDVYVYDVGDRVVSGIAVASE